ncbi:lytic transglycosylase domain-containing protein [Hydrogenimonas thermophila]|nr:lytic transglycosylase domain-containing protein [Hydrogenimonas thermophila]
MKIKFISLLLVAISMLQADEITLKQLEQWPKSYSRDFFIWRYLDQNISAKSADKAFYLINSVNWSLLHRYAKKTKKPRFKMADKCHFLKPKDLPAKDPSCSAIAITPYKFSKLSSSKQSELIKQLKNFPNIVKWMRVMASNDPFLTLIEADSDTFFKIYNQCGRVWRNKFLNHPLPQKLIDQLATRKEFAQTIKLIVTDNNMIDAQKSLFKVDSKKLNHQSTFFLAMNAINFGRINQAKKYLESAYKKAYYRFDLDKTLFWLAQVDPKGKHLDELLKSFDINIYTLYARELKKLPLPKVVTPDFKKSGCDFNISNPFEWIPVLRQIKNYSSDKLTKLAKKFSCDETEGHYSFLMERAARYRTEYFPMPYKNAYKDLPKNDQALILALARQESRFIPSSISTSYALGMMQIMPFLVKSLAKELKEPFDLDKMFDPIINISYAKQHLKFLKRSLYHPLFIAYAYNGGIGFTKRLLKKRGLFKKGKFEPWLSMELVYYDESRRYGKKVLANYIVYKNLLGEPIDVVSSVESLTKPDRTDRFRASK